MNRFQDVVTKTDNMKVIVAIYYDSINNEFSYIPLRIDKEMYIKETFEDYNEKSTPFIYYDTPFRILIGEKTKSFILARNGHTDDRPYISVFESDIKIAYDLLRMQNRVEELHL